MAGPDDALCLQVLEQLEGMDRVSSRRMFGGVGLYAGPRLFGIVFRGAVYLRASDAMRRDLARAGGSGPFRPYRGREVTAYWQLPAAMVADKRRLRAWARRAIGAAESAAQQRTPGRPRPLAPKPPTRPLLGPRRKGRPPR